MDLGLYLRVLWRFRLLVLAGVILGLALAAFLLRENLRRGRVGRAQLSAVGTMGELATVFVTQEGFPLGRSVYDESLPVTPNTVPNGSNPVGSQTYVPRYADPSRFSTYAQLYARIAGSDLLRRR